MFKKLPLPRPLPENVQQIFNLLLQVNEEQRVNGVLRVAGGWVRDMMLCVESNDIDISIETPQQVMDEKGKFITGSQFAYEIQAFNEKHNIQGKTISVIKTNPEKSKHIETAQMTVQGVPLEFCHLRQDEYCQDSRVPVVRPGTPLEDAMRRDFTVNSLFYNLHTAEVEDYTGCGFDDMQAEVLRTPLAPRETFLDDPLRLLRGIRFAGQLGYHLHPDVEAVTGDAEILDALQKKVARERFGIEVGKMLRGNRPTLCMHYMNKLGLLHQSIVFEAVMQKKKKAEIDRIVPVLPQEHGEELDCILSAIDHTGCKLYEELLKSEGGIIKIPNGTDRLIASMFLLCLPIYGELPLTERLERIPAFSTNSLKLPGLIADTVNKLITSYQAVLPHAAELEQVTAAASQNGTAQGKNITGDVREGVFVALQQTSVKNVPLCGLGLVMAAALTNVNGDDQIVSRLGNVLQCVKEDTNGKLSVSATRPPVMKGQDVPNILGVEKKQTGHFLAAQMKYLLHNPDATIDEVTRYLKTVDPLQ